MDYYTELDVRFTDTQPCGIRIANPLILVLFGWGDLSEFSARKWSLVFEWVFSM